MRIEVSENLCPHCDEVVEFESHSQQQQYPLKKGVVEIPVKLSRCPACGGTFTDMKQAEANYELAVKAFRREKNLLHPHQIKNVRDKYSLSQRQFSALLGWSPATLSSYENNKIQDQSHNDELMLLKTPTNMKRVLEVHRENLDEKVAAKLAERVEELMVEERAVLERHQLNSLYDDVTVGIMTGNRSFDLHRFVQAAIYMLKQSGPEFKTKFLKLLFYADFLSFKRHKSSITGAAYAHLPHGPVPDRFQTLIDFMEREGNVAISEQVFDGGGGDVLTATRTPDTDCFSKNEIIILDVVVDKFKSFNTKQIRDISHEEAAYKQTKQPEKISYEFAKELSLD